jgi:hypothetical protein
MTKTIAERDMVMLPKDEYRILKELYKTVKRQNFLFRLEESEKNLKTGKIKKVSVKDFIGMGICQRRQTA